MTITNPADGGPILFLNPLVLLDTLSATALGGEAVRGIRTAPRFPNGSVDRINELCRQTGPSLVLTTVLDLGDLRRRLELIGLRASYHPDWFLDPLETDTAAAIGAWLSAHGSPSRTALIDRPADGSPVIPTLPVPPGGVITVPDVATLATVLA